MRLGPILLLALVAGLAILFMNQGGDVAVSGPSETPELPDANGAAAAAKTGLEKGADTVAGFTRTTWQMISLGLGVVAVMWIWKDPKRRAFALALALVATVVFLVNR